MKPIQEKLSGKLFVAEEQPVLWLSLAGGDGDEVDAAATTTPPIRPMPLYARYALVMLGTDAPLFPAFLLDDWGNELRGAKLYRWLRSQGHLYPRSEIFGYDVQGRETQRFVREIELHERYYCYICTERRAPLEACVLVHDIVLADPGVTTPIATKPPAGVKAPLRRVRAHWHRVPPAALLQNTPLP